jgi:hypothetical protein
MPLTRPSRRLTLIMYGCMLRSRGRHTMSCSATRRFGSLPRQSSTHTRTFIWAIRRLGLLFHQNDLRPRPMALGVEDPTDDLSSLTDLQGVPISEPSEMLGRVSVARSFLPPTSLLNSGQNFPSVLSLSQAHSHPRTIDPPLLASCSASTVRLESCTIPYSLRLGTSAQLSPVVFASRWNQLPRSVALPRSGYSSGDVPLPWRRGYSEHVPTS